MLFYAFMNHWWSWKPNWQTNDLVGCLDELHHIRQSGTCGHFGKSYYVTVFIKNSQTPRVLFDRQRAEGFQEARRKHHLTEKETTATDPGRSWRGDTLTGRKIQVSMLTDRDHEACSWQWGRASLARKAGAHMVDSDRMNAALGSRQGGVWGGIRFRRC